MTAPAHRSPSTPKPVAPFPTPPAGLAGIVSCAPDALEGASGSRGPVWLPPRAVARPRTADEVAAVVSWCAEGGLGLTPRGGATGMPGGNVGPDVVLDLTALDRVDPVLDGRIAAGAGAVAAVVDRHARAAGHHLPALPSSAPWCTVGGMVAAGAAGARSFRYGAARAWTAALEVVRADGSVERHARGEVPPGGQPGAPPWASLRAELTDLPLPRPPRVRKNASGYDVHGFVDTGDPLRLLVGSEGTLAVITGVVLDTEAIPDARGVAVVGVPDVDALPSLAARAAETGATACEYFGRRLLELGGLIGDARLAGLDLTAGALLVEYAGTESEVDDGLAAWAERSRSATAPHDVDALWRLRHDASPAIARAAGRRRSIQFIEDAAVPVVALPAYVRGVEAILIRHGLEAVIFGHAGDGHLHVNPLVDLDRPDWRTTVGSVLDEVVDLVAGLGGTLSGEHGDGRLRAPLLHRVWGAAHVDAFRRVKQTLDPRGLLNPGVILPLAGQDPLAGLAEGPDLQRVGAGAGAEA